MPEISVPGFTPEPRKESPGEAQQRLAGWLAAVLNLPFLRVQFHPFEQDALAVVCGAFIRRWPGLAKWKAPQK